MYRLFLMSLLRMNVLNDVTAALFLVSFSQLPAVKKDTKNGAAVTSLRTFIRSSAFSIYLVRFWIFEICPATQPYTVEDNHKLFLFTTLYPETSGLQNDP